MSAPFNADTLNVFLNTLNDKKEWKARNAANWGAYFDKYGLSETLDRRFTRADFRNPELMTSLSDRELAIAILAWGAMRYDHGARLFEDESFIEVISLMRAGKLNRSEAYEHFYKLKEAGKLNGMGPAYYTKLICFVNPALNGYIMDQWTAKSINLLTDSNMIKLTSGGTVADTNPGNAYESFCRSIEALSEHTNLSPIDTEEALFSYGGRHKGSWRGYVIGKHRK